MKLWKVAVVLAAVAMFSVTANAQDDCTSAVAAPASVDPCADTTPTGPLGSCTSGGGVNDVWVSFVATEIAHRVRTDVGSVGTDSNFIVYGGTCGGLTEIGCSEDGAGASGYLGDIEVGGLTVGATYFIQVGGWSDTCGPFQVNVESVAGSVCGDGVRSAILGEECDGADSAACQGLCQVDCTCPTVACGNGVREGTEQCDDGNLTPGDGCDELCRIELDIVPAISEWGLVVMVLIGLAAGTVMFGRKRATA